MTSQLFIYLFRASFSTGGTAPCNFPVFTVHSNGGWAIFASFTYLPRHRPGEITHCKWQPELPLYTLFTAESCIGILAHVTNGFSGDVTNILLNSSYQHMFSVYFISSWLVCLEVCIEVWLSMVHRSGVCLVTIQTKQPESPPNINTLT